MTRAEKLIWAAAFARYWDIRLARDAVLAYRRAFQGSRHPHRHPMRSLENAEKMLLEFAEEEQQP